MRVSLSKERAKNVYWPWLSPLLEWGSPIIAFLGKCDVNDIVKVVHARIVSDASGI